MKMLKLNKSIMRFKLKLINHLILYLIKVVFIVYLIMNLVKKMILSYVLNVFQILIKLPIKKLSLYKNKMKDLEEMK